jgi:hypothetical protein
MFLKLGEATTRPLLTPHMRLPRPAVMYGVYDGPVVASACQLGRSSNRPLVIKVFEHQERRYSPYQAALAPAR